MQREQRAAVASAAPAITPYSGGVGTTVERESEVEKDPTKGNGGEALEVAIRICSRDVPCDGGSPFDPIAAVAPATTATTDGWNVTGGGGRTRGCDGSSSSSCNQLSRPCDNPKVVSCCCDPHMEFYCVGLKKEIGRLV